jgi:bis(5'-adenosyl)-triphosphatase
VHVHILPRKEINDRFAANNDDVYPALENSEREMRTALHIEGSRPPRSSAEMESEASMLRKYFTKE